MAIGTRTLATLRTNISTKLHAVKSSLGNTNFNALINEALDGLQLYVDFPESENIQTLTPKLFTDVTKYVAPADLKNDNIIGFRPYTEIPTGIRSIKYDEVSSEEFDRNLQWSHAPGMFTIEYDNGVQYIRLTPRVLSTTQNVVLNDCNAYDSNGTWTADTTNSDALNVATDDTTFMEGTGSVSFDIDVSQSVNNKATLYNAGISSTNVSELTSPTLFLYFTMDNVQYLSSVDIIYGSDTSATPSTKANYLTFNSTTQFDGSAFANGKNLIGVALASATETGTVDTTAITYLEVTLNYSASQTDASTNRIDAFVLREGELHEVKYLSKYPVVSAGGTRKQYFTADDDKLNLAGDGEVLFTAFATSHIALSVREYNTYRLYAEQSKNLITEYKRRYPSPRKLVKRRWYTT